MKIPNGWKKVKFGDVVNKVNDKVQNREEWTFERYIGGQHFDEGEIRVTKSSSIKGNEEVIGSAFHMKFKPGHVLYVTRNPRLRKGGMVDFEGVCSNVSFVMQADETQLLQSLLPFIIQTEDFVMHTCNNAHGSTNPFLNWKDIANYEFLLPPIEEQKKISEVLWSLENNVKDLEKMYQKQTLLFKKLTKNLYSKEKNRVKIKETTSLIQYGLSIPLNEKGKYPILKMDNLERGEIKKSGLKYADLLDKDFKKFKLEKGDVLFNRTNSIEHVGRTALFNLEDNFAFASYLIRLKPDKKKILPEYLTQYLIRFNKDLKRFATLGVHQANINAKSLGNYKIPLPEISKQNEIVEIFNTLLVRKKILYKTKENLKNLRNKLSNEFLSGKLKLK